MKRFKEINQLLGFQMLVNLVTNVVIVIMFGFYTTITALDSKFSLSCILVGKKENGTKLWPVAPYIGTDHLFSSTKYSLDKFYWPFLVVLITPIIRIMLVGHWAQVMKDTVRSLNYQIINRWGLRIRIGEGHISFRTNSLFCVVTFS